MVMSEYDWFKQYFTGSAKYMHSMGTVLSWTLLRNIKKKQYVQKNEHKNEFCNFCNQINVLQWEFLSAYIFKQIVIAHIQFWEDIDSCELWFIVNDEAVYGITEGHMAQTIHAVYNMHARCCIA